jgi:FtsH-binding integral membrane protein
MLAFLLQVPESSAAADTTARHLPAELWWPQIHETVSLIAFVLGFLLMLIANFAGARTNRGKLIFAFLFTSVLGILAMQIILKVAKDLGVLQYSWGTIAVIVALILYITAVAIHLYEIVIVSSREAIPPE